MTADTTLKEATAAADASLGRLEDVLARIGDGDLHRAHPGGGWTAAQVVSHISVCTVVWLGDLQRLRHDADLRFFFREEIGHDLVGYPPPTTEQARARIAATRRTLATCLPAVEDDILARTVEIPDLGTMTVAEWTPLILGHLTGHVEQCLDVLRSRGVLPEGA